MRPSPPGFSTLVLLLSTYVLPSAALYFYIDQNVPKCFFEELPKDTLVVGTYPVGAELVTGRGVLEGVELNGGAELGRRDWERTLGWRNLGSIANMGLHG